jgi:hypothetical protein
MHVQLIMCTKGPRALDSHLHCAPKLFLVFVVEILLKERNMHEQEEAALLVIFRSMTKKNRIFLLALAQLLKNNKPAKPPPVP